MNSQNTNMSNMQNQMFNNMNINNNFMQNQILNNMNNNNMQNQMPFMSQFYYPNMNMNMNVNPQAIINQKKDDDIYKNEPEDIYPYIKGLDAINILKLNYFIIQYY